MRKIGICSSVAFALALAACAEGETAGSEESEASETDAGGADQAAASSASPTGDAQTDADGSGADQSSDANEAATLAEIEASVATNKADGDSKPVECTVGSAPGDWEYQGQCEYFILGGDSMTLVRTDGQPFHDNMIEIVIEADLPTQAHMSVRTSDGERPSMGIAYRENAQDTCWVNDSLDFCWKDM